MKTDLVFRDVISINLEPLAVVAAVLEPEPQEDADVIECHDIADKFCYICRAAGEYLEDMEAFDRPETSQGALIKATTAMRRVPASWV